MDDYVCMYDSHYALIEWFGYFSQKMIDTDTD